MKAGAIAAALVLAVAPLASPPAQACTRALYVGDSGQVITGRSMDWSEDMRSNLWVFPAGIERTGNAGPRSPRWRSKYGSVVVSGYDIGSVDGMNERGLVANALYLAETDYGPPNSGRPPLSISLWAQYVLDNFATVAEAVDALGHDPFQIIAPPLPDGKPISIHLSLSDAHGDSAILEYIDGKLVVMHDKAYKVMTNSPIYPEQLALNTYWKGVGGLAFLPGTNRAADRFVRASFLLDAIPKRPDPAYMAGVPQQNAAYQAVASVMSLMRSVSVPLGISTPNMPNLSSTIWRTVSDQTNLVYYFDSATRPDTFWISLRKLDLKPGAPVMKLTIDSGQVYSGEVAGNFVATPSFKFMPAPPP
ncbi:linear amide C-N hydrolase [Paraburkholderia acidisoli]|uniref:Linear amide C-N hydrolase n=1 Tax=Paraburkholderia acidisoli TaxID=2571748 RepID=A0A7Z2JI60_9BURK|nr:linear amide C-N hydrolase [Paraburkholderia acidisoli]QGZ66577.1 linear amide C-N hydrolase [Paraburkholderia acidisoli]